MTALEIATLVYVVIAIPLAWIGPAIYSQMIYDETGNETTVQTYIKSTLLCILWPAVVILWLIRILRINSIPTIKKIFRWVFIES